MMTAIYNKSPIFIQNLMLNVKSLELYFERYGKKFWRLYEEFEKNQWLSASEMEAYQNEKLSNLIHHAFETVPFYHQRMRALKLRPDDIRRICDLYKLPILTREEIKHNQKQLISTSYPKMLLRKGHTSGTTGSPLDFYYDIQTCVVHHVADWRQKLWAGLKYGERYASLQGRVVVPLKQKRPLFWRKNYINNQLFLSSFHLQEKNIGYYFDKLAQDGIRFIEGYPSTIYILALYLRKKNETFPMKAVLTSSETLFEYQRELIEHVFCCKVFDFYGMAERVVYANECERHQGHHLSLDYGITEFLDSYNEPVTTGKLGRIVATSLHNFAMPFIRYQTNDSCSLKPDPCTCGRVFPLMDDVATKNESIVTLPDGRLVSPSVLTHPFKPMHNIIESQIVQQRIDELIVNIVRNENYGKEDEKKLLNAFHERLGDDMKIRLNYVDSIPRTNNSKLKWVISRIEPKF